MIFFSSCTKIFQWHVSFVCHNNSRHDHRGLESLSMEFSRQFLGLLLPTNFPKSRWIFPRQRYKSSQKFFMKFSGGSGTALVDIREVLIFKLAPIFGLHMITYDVVSKCQIQNEVIIFSSNNFNHFWDFSVFSPWTIY